jgi:hypothetical protein
MYSWCKLSITWIYRIRKCAHSSRYSLSENSWMHHLQAHLLTSNYMYHIIAQRFKNSYYNYGSVYCFSIWLSLTYGNNKELFIILNIISIVWTDELKISLYLHNQLYSRLITYLDLFFTSKSPVHHFLYAHKSDRHFLHICESMCVSVWKLCDKWVALH